MPCKLKSILYRTICGSLVVVSLNACAITLTTVAGVAAYVSPSSTNEVSHSQQLEQKINAAIPNSSIRVAILHQSYLLAGEAPLDSDLATAKALIYQDESQAVVYSYLRLGMLAESSSIKSDNQVQGKITALFKRQQLQSRYSATIFAGKVYVLAAANESAAHVSQVMDQIVSIQAVTKVTMVQESAPPAPSSSGNY